MRPGWNHLQSTPPFLADRPKSLRTCPKCTNTQKQPQKLIKYDRTRITALVTPVGLEPTTRWLKASYAHPVAPRGQTHSSQPRSGPANYLRLCFITSIISVVRGRVELPILSAARFELAVYAIPPPDHARLSGPPSQLCKKIQSMRCTSRRRWARRESNPHSSRNLLLGQTCIPFSPRTQVPVFPGCQLTKTF